MRKAKTGKERWVVRLMKEGKSLEAAAYMKREGMIQNFAGAPQSAPISNPKAETEQFVQPKEYRYPDFKPVRDPVPAGIRWARVTRHLANQLMKIIEFEDDQCPGIGFMGIREQNAAIKRKGKLVGQTFAWEVNPDTVQGGWRLWRR